MADVAGFGIDAMIAPSLTSSMDRLSFGLPTMKTSPA